MVWALFLALNVAFTYASREAVRELLERRWRAGIGLKRILIAGAGDLGRMIATDPAAPRARLSGRRVRRRPRRRRPSRLPRAAAARHAGGGREIAQRERIDQVYVALPLEEHTKILDSMESPAASASTSRSSPTSCSSSPCGPGSRTSTACR